MPRTRPDPRACSVVARDLGAKLGVEAAIVMEYVELGLVRPATGPAALAEADIARLSRAVRLAREFELHAAAAALVVDLLEERDALRRRVACLEQLVSAGN